MSAIRTVVAGIIAVAALLTGPAVVAASAGTTVSAVGYTADDTPWGP